MLNFWIIHLAFLCNFTIYLNRIKSKLVLIRKTSKGPSMDHITGNIIKYYFVQLYILPCHTGTDKYSNFFVLTAQRLCSPSDKRPKIWWMRKENITVLKVVILSINYDIFVLINHFIRLGGGVVKFTHQLWFLL